MTDPEVFTDGEGFPESIDHVVRLTTNDVQIDVGMTRSELRQLRDKADRELGDLEDVADDQEGSAEP